MKYKTILWDIDGTLLDFTDAERNSISVCFKEFGFGLLTEEMLQKYSIINAGYWKRLETGELTKQQVLVGRFQEFFSSYGLDASQASAFNDSYQVHLGDEVYPFPNANEVLHSLHSMGIKQYAVTNGTKIAQDLKLARSGYDKIFDGIFISEVVGYEKPKREFFENVFSVIGQTDLNQVIIVGDSLTGDIRGGNNAGIATCWFNPQGQVNCLGVRVDYEIKDLSDVLNFFK